MDGPTDSNASPPPPPAFAPPEAIDAEAAVGAGSPGGGREGDRGWATPEAGSTAATSARRRAEWEGARVDGGPPAPPVPLKPMTTSDILDGAWAILKASPRTVFAIAAVLVVPVSVIVAWANRDVTQSTDFTALFTDPLTANASTGADAGSLILRSAITATVQTLPYMFLGGAIGRLVVAWYAGTTMSARQAIGAAFGRFGSLLAAWAMLLLVKAPAVAVCAGLPFVAIVPVTFFVVTGPAIVVENLGPWAGIRRSATLVARRFWPALLVVLLATVVEFMVELVITLIPGVVTAFTPEVVGDILEPAATGAAHLLTAPVLAGAAVLLYLDLRVRTEGLDLELESTDAFARAS